MSIEMLKLAASQGIKKVVSTVHYQHPRMNKISLSYDNVKKDIEILQMELDRLFIPIKLYLEKYSLPNLMEEKIILNYLVMVNTC